MYVLFFYEDKFDVYFKIICRIKIFFDCSLVGFLFGEIVDDFDYF